MICRTVVRPFHKGTRNDNHNQIGGGVKRMLWQYFLQGLKLVDFEWVCWMTDGPPLLRLERLFFYWKQIG